MTQQVKTNDKLLNETKKYVFFENKNNNVLLSVFLKNPSCFSLMKRTPSFSNLCDGWAANPVTSLLLKRIWVDAFTVWNEKKMKQWINKEPIITCVSRIVVFIVKNFNTKIWQNKFWDRQSTLVDLFGTVLINKQRCPKKIVYKTFLRTN